MFVEHIIFGIGIAILAGAAGRWPEGRDRSWIVVVGAAAPDIDMTIDLLHWVMPGIIPLGLLPLPFHGWFHTLGFLALFAVGAGLILPRAGIGAATAALLAGIGFGSHLIEDALVDSLPGYPYLWPLSHERFVMPVFPGERDLFGLANTESLAVALGFAAAAVLVRAAAERRRLRRPP